MTAAAEGSVGRRRRADGARPLACFGGRDSPGRAPLRLRLHEPRDAGACSTTTRPIRACCGCSTARRCGAARPARRADPAPTATATAEEHAGRRGALPGLQRRARPPDRPAGPHQSVPRAPKQNATPFASESRELLALAAYVAHQSRGHADRAGEDPRLAALPRARPRALSSSAKGSSTSPAPTATTTIGARARRQRRSRRRTRPAIRSTGSNGRASGPCSAGCATA